MHSHEYIYMFALKTEKWYQHIHVTDNDIYWNACLCFVFQLSWVAVYFVTTIADFGGATADFGFVFTLGNLEFTSNASTFIHVSNAVDDSQSIHKVKT